MVFVASRRSRASCWPPCAGHECSGCAEGGARVIEWAAARWERKKSSAQRGVLQVWKVVRDFAAVPTHFSGVKAVELEGGGPTSVGVVRVVKWATGEERRQQLIELSDQYRHITWETVGANHQTESSAQISCIRLFRITETKECLVEWATDFAADVDTKVACAMGICVRLC